MSYFKKMIILSTLVTLTACGLTNEEAESAPSENLTSKVSEKEETVTSESPKIIEEVIEPDEVEEPEELEESGEAESEEVETLEENNTITENIDQVSLVENDVQSLYEELNGELFTFEIGRGGWKTVFTFEEEGKFTGNYHKYNNSERIMSDFKGKFTIHEQIDEYTYYLTLEEFEITSETGKEEVIWDLPTTYVDYVHGFPDESYEFELYLPSKPKSEVSDEYLTWVYEQDMNDLDYLNTFGLYNLTPEFGMQEFGY